MDRHGTIARGGADVPVMACPTSCLPAGQTAMTMHNACASSGSGSGATRKTREYWEFFCPSRRHIIPLERLGSKSCSTPFDNRSWRLKRAHITADPLSLAQQSKTPSSKPSATPLPTLSLSNTLPTPLVRYPPLGMPIACHWSPCRWLSRRMAS
jgi:hypothetical protein